MDFLNSAKCKVCLIVAIFISFSLEALQESPSFPDKLLHLIQSRHELPKYAEAYYSPLGRSPAVDALLGDPFYMPVYAEKVSTALREKAKEKSLFQVKKLCFLASGIAVKTGKITSKKEAPLSFNLLFGDELGSKMYSLFDSFVQTREEVDKILSPITSKEKKWLISNPEAFFFGKQSKNIYHFFTSKSDLPLKFFEIASRVDFVRLAECSMKLSSIVDTLFQMQKELSSIELKEDFIWKEKGVKLIVSSRSNAVFKESADMFIHLKGESIFANNAGGTEGIFPTALHVSLKGDNIFIGERFVQGAGILGIGILANFSGNNIYKAESFSQAAGFFGIGTLLDFGGNNDYQLSYFGQSAALFGASLLWNKKGDSRYTATFGMAQAASSTLGTAFLIDGAKSSFFSLGEYGSKGVSKKMGIGQGGSIGTRFDPWNGNPSFYGGLSFLFSQGGKNIYKGAWYSQGSSYFLGAGILVDEGEGGKFISEVNSQGQGLHLAAGLLLKKGGNCLFDSGWGSIGTGGDRSVGMVVNTGGDSFYRGAQQTIGAARKPIALGIFINLQGGNSYAFDTQSCGSILLPEAPLEWPEAFFLAMGKPNRYTSGLDSNLRCHNCTWTVEDKAVGIDMGSSKKNLYQSLLNALPQSPRVEPSFTPFKAQPKNWAYRPLKRLQNSKEALALIDLIPQSNYGKRRLFYESLDLYKFLNPGVQLDFSPLIKDFGKAEKDQINYALLWVLNERDKALLPSLAKALETKKIRFASSRRLAIELIGSLGEGRYKEALESVLNEDASLDNKALAAFVLAKNAAEKMLPLLKKASENVSVAVRFAVATGLKDNPLALPLVVPMLKDKSFYVRRAAAMTAISLHYKPAISVLLKTLDFKTLDLTENYGDNIFKDLSFYLGVDFGLDTAAWKAWWKKNKKNFHFSSEMK